MKRVTGIGGVFFRAKQETKNVNDWYEKHLGIDYAGAGGYPYWEWRSMADPNKKCATVWSVFAADTKYFGNPDQQFMINFRVHDLVALIDVLRKEGVTILDEIAEYDYGKFCWIADPDGNRIELWEPAGDVGFPGGMPAE